MALNLSFIEPGDRVAWIDRYNNKTEPQSNIVESVEIDSHGSTEIFFENTVDFFWQEEDELLGVTRNGKIVWPTKFDWPSDGIPKGDGTPDVYVDPFADIARELIEIHDRKGKDYGTTGDPYANVRMSEAFGIPAWIGVGIRMNDKMKRLQTAANQYLTSGEVRLQHEGLIDIARDFAVYGVILEIMIREWIEAGNEDKSEGRL